MSKPTQLPPGPDWPVFWAFRKGQEAWALSFRNILLLGFGKMVPRSLPIWFLFCLTASPPDPGQEGHPGRLRCFWEDIWGRQEQECSGAFIFCDFFFPLCPRRLCMASVISTDWGSDLHSLRWLCLLVPPHLQASVSTAPSGWNLPTMKVSTLLSQRPQWEDLSPPATRLPSPFPQEQCPVISVVSGSRIGLDITIRESLLTGQITPGRSLL